jgi:ATP-dependent DNA helicase RecQ
VWPRVEADPSQLMAWLAYGDVCRAAGTLDRAEEAYRRAGELAPDAAAPVRRLAELQLQAGDAAAARGLLETLVVREERSPTIEELRLLLGACRALDDAAAMATLEAQLAAREHEERVAVEAELGLHHEEVPNVAAAPAPQASGQLPPEAYATLREQFGLDDFRPNQAQVIASVLKGASTLAVMPTGAGKSLTYQLPALLLPHATLVVSPLIALMKDQLDGLPAGVRARATAINSSLSGAEIQARLKGIADGTYKLVYVAPERLRQLPFLHALKKAGVSLLVIDEAHCVSMWGLSFRPDYLFIGAARRELGSPPVLALTATASGETQAEVQERLGPLEPVVASVFRPNLRFEVVRAGNREEKQEQVVKLCAATEGAIIVYARSRESCETLAALLRRKGISAEHYHTQVADRAGVQERFMRNATRVLVATVAFGMGVDKADVRAIIHYNLPQSVEAYYQEAGRAGRDGQPARCVLLYSSADKGQMTTWLRETAINRDDLRDLYKLIRAQSANGWATVSLEQLQRRLQSDDDTLVRVGLSMLERVGLLRRHFDLPRTATITLRGTSTDELFPLTEAVGLGPGEAAEVDLLALAEALQRAPNALEAELLRHVDAGLLRYSGTGREPLLELLAAPPNVGAAIDTLLTDYQSRQDQRIEAMGAYARGGMCRHRALAAHFGQKLGRCVSACDICAPTVGALARSERGLRSGARVAR